MQGIGDDDSIESSSATLVETTEGFQPVFFEPRELTNLALLDEMESLCPLMDMKVRPTSHTLHIISLARLLYKWSPLGTLL